MDEKVREYAKSLCEKLRVIVNGENYHPFDEPEHVENLAGWISRIRAEARAEIAYGSHVLYEIGDADAPAQIKDANGDVCLGMCRNCGRSEAELSEVCDHRMVKAEALKEAAEKLERWCDDFDVPYFADIRSVLYTTDIHKANLKETVNSIRDRWGKDFDKFQIVECGGEAPPVVFTDGTADEPTEKEE